MTSRTTRRTRLLAAVATTAGALAFALLPASAAHAVGPTPPPAFAFIDANSLTPNSAAPDGLGTVTALVPPGYRAFDVDVTPDGLKSVMSLCNGSANACTDNPAGSRFDGTYGVVYQDATTTRLLTNLTNTNAVVTRDGSKVMWVYAHKLYTYLTASGTYPAPVAVPALAATEVPVRLAASVDGGNVAIMFADGTAATAARLLVASAATGKTTPFFEKSYARSVALRPNAALFTFIDATTIVYDEDNGTANAPRSAFRASIGGTATAVPALNAYYALRSDGTTWWTWKDSASDATLSSVDDPTLPTPTVTLSTATPRIDGGSTYGYVPTAAAPPVLDPTKVANPAASHTTFGFSAKTVAFDGRSAYLSYNLYGGQPDGIMAVNRNEAAESDRGTLERSLTNGATWAPIATTSGAKAFVLAGRFYNGYATGLHQNTLFRWKTGGDGFTTAITSVVMKVSVVPGIGLKVVKKGTARAISGSAQRPTGVAQLHRLVKGHWVKVFSVKLVKASTFYGTYVFPTRVLPAGTYRVVTLADTYAAAGAKVFKL